MCSWKKRDIIIIMNHNIQLNALNLQILSIYRTLYNNYKKFTPIFWCTPKDKVLVFVVYSSPEIELFWNFTSWVVGHRSIRAAFHYNALFLCPIYVQYHIILFKIANCSEPTVHFIKFFGRKMKYMEILPNINFYNLFSQSINEINYSEYFVG